MLSDANTFLYLHEPYARDMQYSSAYIESAFLPILKNRLALPACHTLTKDHLFSLYSKYLSSLIMLHSFRNECFFYLSCIPIHREFQSSIVCFYL